MQKALPESEALEPRKFCNWHSKATLDSESEFKARRSRHVKGGWIRKFAIIVGSVRSSQALSGYLWLVVLVKEE